jgi:N6-L-threonylcarbamoyladenine synthase/protein kinase Bud32
MRVLGIEGTAWAASAAVHDTATDDTRIFTEAYQPDSGGIHPREAAEHMREHLPRMVRRAREHAEDGGGVDAVAFSRGPGLGPCLRIAGTAARATSLALEVPLVGVNHMLAHLEIGRHGAGFETPVCLNASGANAHVLGYRGGRYRVLGETMDTGVGNAIDKFARHVGWSHPGGPKVEQRAREGSPVELPYVVKGMDFSFAGLTTAASDAYDDGVPVEDVCFSLQEHAFGMLTEVAERALSLTANDELVLGGGVGQNERLRGMLADMCEQRGARFHAPEPRFLRDNAGMIAVLGARMAAAGEAIAVEDSRVRPDWRPDQVAVTWQEGSVARRATEGPQRGAEAVVEREGDDVLKRRLPKGYRHPALDDRLRRERTRAEARLLHEARGLGVPTPVLRDVDDREATLTVERVGEADLRDALSADRVRSVARHLATLHGEGTVHGDPTVRNVRVGGDAPADRAYLIDFGLGYASRSVEDFAMDLHVFEGSLVGTAEDPEPLLAAFEAAYREHGDPAVLDRLREIEGRGRYQ